MASAAPPSPWSELLPELLGRVIARLPMPNDLARFRLVCRSWHSAAREHGGRRLPWIVHSDGSFVVLPRRVLHRPLPLPQGTRFIGASGSWFVLDRTDVCGKRCTRNYFLNNPFFGMTVPLLGLDSVIGDFPDGFKVRKVLMRSSSPDDLIVAVTTDKYCNYQIILCRPGKHGAWASKTHAMPYTRIRDVAFLGDNLYGITYGEGLVHLGLGEDYDNKPIVTNFEHIIKHQHSYAEDDDEISINGDDDDDEVSINGDDHDDEVSINEGGSDDGGLTSEGDGSDDDEELSRRKEEDNGEALIGNDTTTTNGYIETSSVEDKNDTGESTDPDGTDEPEDPEGTIEPEDTIITSRYFLESDGKLLMVKRCELSSPYLGTHNLKVDVMEADMDAGVWVPATAVNARAIFISNQSSKSALAHGKAQTRGFKCYFEDEHDEFTPYDGTVAYVQALLNKKSTWVFPPEVVI